VERTAWTDERLDDLVHTLNRNFDLLREEIHGLRSDVREEIHGLRDDMRSLREDLSASQRQFAQIGWGLVAALIAALVALILALA
jgi:hypothetical protein